MQEVIQARVMNKRASETYWLTRNPRLLNGEIAIVDVGGRDRIKIGNGTALFDALPYFDESAGAYQGLATPTSYPNPASINMWYFAGPGTYTNYLDGSGNPIVVNGQLAILSKSAGVWSKLDVISATGYVENRIIVKQGGTVGVDCDADTINALYNFIVTNTSANRFVFEVMPGNYEEVIALKDYMNIEGHTDTTGNRPVISGTKYPTGADEVGTHVITCTGRAKISNIDIVAFKTQYAILYNDASDTTREVTLENCRVQHFGGNITSGNGYNDLWAIMYYSQKLNLINSDFLGIFTGCIINNLPFITNRSNNHAFNVLIDGCKMHSLTIGDYLQYSHDKIELRGNQIVYLLHNCYTSVYVANPGVSTANRGFYPNPITVVNTGNKIGYTFSSGQTYKAITGRYQIYRGFNEEMQNASGATIPEGIAVIRSADATLPNAWTYGDKLLPYSRMTRYSSSGARFVIGFTQESINAGSTGAVRLLSNFGFIKASFDNANGSVGDGDELQLQNNGQIAKRSSGDLFGIAAGAPSGGFVDFRLI